MAKEKAQPNSQAEPTVAPALVAEVPPVAAGSAFDPVAAAIPAVVGKKPQEMPVVIENAYVVARMKAAAAAE